MTRQPLPPGIVILRCEACGADVETLDVNTQRLASELSRLRREHASRRHGWSPVSTVVAASERRAR